MEAGSGALWAEVEVEVELDAAAPVGLAISPETAGAPPETAVTTLGAVFSTPVTVSPSPPLLPRPWLAASLAACAAMPASATLPPVGTWLRPLEDAAGPAAVAKLFSCSSWPRPALEAAFAATAATPLSATLWLAAVSVSRLDELSLFDEATGAGVDCAMEASPLLADVLVARMGSSLVEPVAPTSGPGRASALGTVNREA